jgi:hypothetical protein
MTQMMTLPQIAREVGDMVRTGFLPKPEVVKVLAAKFSRRVTEGEAIEMFQELIDVATIKQLSK